MTNADNTAVLTVTPEGKFIWNENADRMIENGDYTASPAMPHILRHLRERDEMFRLLIAAMNDADNPGDWFYEARKLVDKATGNNNGHNS